MEKGDRIRFKHTIIEEANGDHPEFLMAKGGEGGWIEKDEPTTFKGKPARSVFWDGWPSAPFIACEDEFILTGE